MLKEVISQGHYYAGEWHLGINDKEMHAYDPSTWILNWSGCAAGSESASNAVTAARVALPAWSSLSLDQRIKYIQAFVEQVENSLELFTKTISFDTGKPLWEARMEVRAMIKKAEVSIAAYHQRTGEVTRKTQLLQHRPLGVMVVLGPFNLPGHLPNGQMIPALLAGNTVVFKPSEHTPCIAELIMSCWHATGIPAGVVNMVHGGKATGEALLRDKVDGVLFTGSYQTGRAIHQFFAGKPEVLLALEMGGNNPLIVGKLKNLTAAAYSTVHSAFITAGQRCTCARKLLIPNNGNGDKFLRVLLNMTKQLGVSRYMDVPQPFMGPVISPTAAKNLLEEQRRLKIQGADILNELKQLHPNTGMVAPGIVDVTGIKDLRDQETFGPLLKVIRYDDFSQAIELANDTEYGLAAGLLSESKDHFQEFYASIKAGIVNWNQPLTGASSDMPFGGIGRSGNHRPGAFYTADACAYPVVSKIQEKIVMPKKTTPGISV